MYRVASLSRDISGTSEDFHVQKGPHIVVIIAFQMQTKDLPTKSLLSSTRELTIEEIPARDVLTKKAVP